MAANLPSPFTIFSQELLAKVNQIFWNFNETPFNFAEISHRSAHFNKVNEESMKVLAKYHNIPNNYHVLYLPQDCGVSSIPFNLNKLTNFRSIFVVTDAQSQKAYQYAALRTPQTIKITKMEDRPSAVKKLGEPFYFYTFYSKLSLQSGQFVQQPEPLQGQILICSLNACSYYKDINIAKHGIVLFESGRGIGLSGMSIVIVRKDLVGMQLSLCPDMLCYEKTLTTNSVINTPHTFVPLLILKQLELWVSKGQTLQWNRQELKKIKIYYENELSKYTEVVKFSAEGLVKFRLPINFKVQQAQEFGYVQGEYLTILLQLQNKGKEAIFASKIFK